MRLTKKIFRRAFCFELKKRQFELAQNMEIYPHGSFHSAPRYR